MTGAWSVNIDAKFIRLLRTDSDHDGAAGPRLPTFVQGLSGQHATPSLTFEAVTVDQEWCSRCPSRCVIR